MLLRSELQGVRVDTFCPSQSGSGRSRDSYYFMLSSFFR